MLRGVQHVSTLVNLSLTRRGLMFLGGDQNPLNWGALMASVMMKRYQSRTQYFWHDVDGQGSMPKLINFTQHGSLTIGETRDRGFVLAGMNRGFSYPVLRQEDVLWKIGELMSQEQTATRRLLYRMGFSMVNRGSPDGVGKAVGEIIRPNLPRRKVAIWGTRQMISRSLLSDRAQSAVEDYFSRLLDWYEERVAPALSSERKSLASATRLRELRSAVVQSTNLYDAYSRITELIVGEPVLTTTTSEYIKSDVGGWSQVLKAALTKPTFLKVYNSVTSSRAFRDQNGGEKPFFVLWDKNGASFRDTLYISNGQVRVGWSKSAAEVSQVNVDTVYEAVSKLLEESGAKLVAIVPKALLFPIEARMKFSFYFGQIPYMRDTNRIARKLGLKLLPMVQVHFEKPGKVLTEIGCVPDMAKVWQISLPDSKNQYWQNKFIQAAQEMTLEHWLGGQNLDMMATYILGGHEAIHRIARSARLRVQS